MSMSTNVVGFKLQDSKFRSMKDVKDACDKAGISAPKIVDEYFGYEEQGDLGIRISGDFLRSCGAVIEYSAEMKDGFDIVVDKIPQDVGVIRVYNAY